MSFRHPPRRGAAFARPLVFSLLMVYGLASFLLGWQDWQQRHRLPLGAELALVVGGLVLGSAAIRVILRRRRAFGRAALGLGILLIADLVWTLVPGADEDWRYPVVRAALSAAILLLMRPVDAAVEAPEG
ncbi:MAG: hypothetical protein R3C71_06195 [Candidatus Krumholzibacteriia bacterium]|nr:hypothetical protein [bacterium]